MGACLGKQSSEQSFSDVVYMDRPMIEHCLRGLVDARTLVSYPALADKFYACLRKEDVEGLLATKSVSKIKYIADKMDCDNFALVLAGRLSEMWGTGGTDVKAGLAFGFVHGDLRKAEEPDKPRPHAINFFIDANGKVWFVEPQTNEVFDSLGAGSRIWLMYL